LDEKAKFASHRCIRLSGECPADYFRQATSGTYRLLAQELIDFQFQILRHLFSYHDQPP